MVTSRPVTAVTADNARGSLVYALPKTLITVTVMPPGAGPANVEVTPKVVADPTQVYVLDYTPSPFSNDDLMVTVGGRDDATVKGLNATAEDQTQAILTEAARSAGRVLNQFSAASQPAAEPQPLLQREVDPHDPWMMDALRADLARFGLDIRCWPHCPPPSLPAEDTAPGLFMRAQVPVQLAVCRGSCDTVAAPERLVTVPSYNASPIFRFPVRRSGFVTRTTSITVKTDDQGKLVRTIEVAKPSQAVAVAQTPGAVVGSFFQGIGDAATGRKELMEQQTALVTAQTGLMTAQMQQWDAEAALRTAMEQAGGASQ
jgi:hypothetical protein